MLGLAHYSIAVVSVIIDRKLCWIHTIYATDPDWPQQLASFFKKEDNNKKRVIMVKDIGSLNRLKAEVTKAGGDAKCVFLVFDTAENLSSLQDITIIDAVAEDDSWRYIKLPPPKLKDILEEADFGMSTTQVAAKPKASAEPVSAVAATTEPTVVFDRSKNLFFQLVENCLATCAEEQHRKILRQLIAAWFEGGLSPDYGTRIVKRLEKYGGNVASYLELTAQGDQTGYLASLKAASRAAAAHKDIALKDVAQNNNVRLGDLKWLNQNWPFSNLTNTPELQKDM